MKQVGFHAEHRPLNPTERLEKIKRETEEPRGFVGGGYISPPSDYWNYAKKQKASRPAPSAELSGERQGE